MHRAALILLLAADSALAHPEHGAGGWLSANISHLLSEPDHLALILLPLIVGAGWLAKRAMDSRRDKRARRD